MVRKFSTLSLAALASLSSLAVAQQPIQPGQVQPGQSQAGQTLQGQAQRAGQAGAQSQGLNLNAFIAHQLKRGNEAEVELGQMASERAKSDSVKEFADTMVKTHREMIQKLDQLDHGMSVGAGTTTNPAGTTNPSGAGVQPTPAGNPNPTNLNTTNAIPQERRVGDNVRNSESNTSDDLRASDRRPASGGSQAASPAGAAPSTSTPNQAAVAGQDAAAQNLNRGANQGVAGNAARAQMGAVSGNVPQMLVALQDQACDNELQLTKEMLQKHEGEDFEMAYIGQQIVAHTCMLAHLQALRTSGPQELQQLATQGEKTTREHLDHAMKIAHELAGDEKSKK